MLSDAFYQKLAITCKNLFPFACCCASHNLFCPGVQVSQCLMSCHPHVPVSHCLGFPLSWCPSVLMTQCLCLLFSLACMYVCMYLFPLSISFELFSQLKDCTVLLYADGIKLLPVDRVPGLAKYKDTFVFIQVLTCNLNALMMVFFLISAGS